MTHNTPQNAHGGARKGSGRKPTAPHLRTRPVTVALPQWLVDKLPQENRGAYIQAALVAYLKITPPID